MSKPDIRNFFTVLGKKSTSTSTNSSSNSKNSQNTKTKARKLLDSSDEDIVESTPEQASKKKNLKKRKAQLLSSDSEPDSPKKAAPSKVAKKSPKDAPKLKPINIADIFGNKTVKQTKVEYVPKKEDPEPIKKESEPKSKKGKKEKKSKTELGIHKDKVFEQTLLDLDDDVIFDNVDLLYKTIDETLASDIAKEVTGETSKKTVEEGNIKGVSTENKQSPKNKAQKDDKKRSRKDAASPGITPSKKQKMEHSDSGIDPGQEIYERRRHSAVLYQKYLNRGGPRYHGMKEIPKGKPDCLKDLCFIKTGVLDSLESEEFENLVKEHGGRVVHAVSKKVNYVVVGEEPGPAKLAKAESLKIPTITEDDLLNMIREKSGLPVIKQGSELSEDQGVDTECLSIKSTSVDSDFEESHKKFDVKEKAQNKPNLKKLTDTKVKTEVSSSSKSETSKSEKLKSPMKEKSKIRESKEETEKHVKSPKKEVQPKPRESKGETKKHVESLKKEKEVQPKTVREVKSVDPNSLCWTEKYKPTDIKAIIGQQGDMSNMNKLKRWLMNWDKYHGETADKNKKLVKPSMYNQNHAGEYFKCALLSGSPGVGKTTTATLVSQELGFDIVEFNASDTRSKKLLHEEVAQLLSNQTLAGFAAGEKKTSRKRVLLMDEVDGMAGNEDRGGIQELINLIKTTHIPIICMCNDRNHQKMRSLVNYCFDLRFSKPRLEQIRGAMMSICFKENVKLSPQALTEIISGTGCDIRLTLNHLSMLSSGINQVSDKVAEKEAKIAKKDVVLGPWEVCKTVFSESDHKGMSLADKSRLFFFDYSLGPLFVQENYLKVTPNSPMEFSDHLRAVAAAADSLSMGDIIEKKIRSSNNWSLLETQAFYSSVIPGHYVKGYFTPKKFITFPSWFGKNSKKTKFNRFANELLSHMRTKTLTTKSAIKLDYVSYLRHAIMRPLKTDGMDGIQRAVSVMKGYNLLREDLDSLTEMGQYDKEKLYDVDSKVKAAFTRTYNKEITLLPYASGAGFSKKRSAAVLDELEDEEDVLESDDDDDLTKDAMIKVKEDSKNSKGSNVKPKGSNAKAKGTNAKPKSSNAKPSTSKKAEPKTGKGKKGK